MLLLDGLQSLCDGWTLMLALKFVNEHSTWLVPIVDGSLGWFEEPRSGHVRQSYGQIVDHHSIVTSSGLDDHVVDLDELFRVTGAVILVDQPRVELVWPSNSPELGRQSTEHNPS
jgi:hypothetical protein